MSCTHNFPSNSLAFWAVAGTTVYLDFHLVRRSRLGKSLICEKRKFCRSGLLDEGTSM